MPDEDRLEVGDLVRGRVFVIHSALVDQLDQVVLNVGDREGVVGVAAYHN